MAEDHPRVAAAPRVDLEPGLPARGLRARRTLHLQIDLPIRAAVAQARECIDHEPPAIDSLQGLAPAIGLVAIHPGKEFRGALTQHLLHFARQSQYLGYGPLGHDARVNHQIIGTLWGRLRSAYGERTTEQPLEQPVAIAGLQDLIERVALAQFPTAAERHGEQVQVMIAEYYSCISPKGADEAQHAERLWAAINEIADEPQFVAVR